MANTQQNKELLMSETPLDLCEKERFLKIIYRENCKLYPIRKDPAQLIL